MAGGGRFSWRAATVCGLIAMWAAPMAAQETSKGVREVIDRLFEGMRQADAEKAGSAFAEGARFAMLPEEGETAVEYRDIDGWLSAVGESAGRWREEIDDVEIRVDGEIASAWMSYTFYLDGSVRHCGVNSFALLNTAQGWKITQVSDTRRTQGCRDVLGTNSS